ncbi:hypothetical protein [Arthrobacter sp. zg-Y1110]|uniref:hypothetical protein n=1 Tax=Arthrobacter sp. zg-Y1110 TaxID=2886932 RepID=UPI001D141DBF|nr:hypothetical protein [Arthrobacter sp. zg-Y1110]MCC3292922.1 hypothetical protein [Arthrobacter sp. zg-Y1110]UWX86861.1 hypothetical protein N2K99_18635 [Arthrobacter sp. zg-Y1110]
MPRLTLEEFKARNHALNTAAGRDAVVLGDDEWAWMQSTIPMELASARAEQRAMDVKLAWAAVTRENLDTFAYLSGETDTHPLIHGAPATLEAADLSGRHLGTTVRSLTYRERKKTARPDPGERTYLISNIQHLKDGGVLINGSWPYLRAGTVLTVVEQQNRAARAA